MTRNDCAAQRPLAEGAVAAESYLSAAPKAPLCKGPARERCLWQKKRPQRPSSHWPWRAATRAGKVSWQPGTVSRQADWGIDAEVYQHRITTPPALRATSPYTGEALTCVRRKRSGTAAQRTRDARPYYEDDCLGGGRRGRCLHRPVPRRGKNALPVRYGPKDATAAGRKALPPWPACRKCIFAPLSPVFATSKSCKNDLIERAGGPLPPAPIPRCSGAADFSVVF